MQYRATLFFLLYKKDLIGTLGALKQWELFHEDGKYDSDDEALRIAEQSVKLHKEKPHNWGEDYLPEFGLVFVSRTPEQGPIEIFWKSAEMQFTEDGKLSFPSELFEFGLQFNPDQATN